jgi:hypothetical protein
VSLHSYSTTPEASHVARANGSSPEHIFLWVVMILALAFWTPFAVIVDSGILAAGTRIDFSGEGAADAGGIGWALINILGPMLLALGPPSAKPSRCAAPVLHRPEATWRGRLACTRAMRP